MKKSTLITVFSTVVFFFGFHLVGWGQSLCGTKTVGVGGDYTTLTDAIADLNSKDLCGPLILNLKDATYPDEIFPIIINYNAGSSSTNTVTIKPSTGVSPVIICNSFKVPIILNGSDYVMIDGSNQDGGSSKDLTITNTFTGDTSNSVIIFEDNGSRGATNTTIMNCILGGTSTVASSFGLYLNDDKGGNFQNTSILNNAIKNAKIGIRIADANNGIISGNIIGDLIEPVTQGGIEISYCDNTLVTGNDIFGEIEGNTTYLQYGIAIMANTTNSKITKNKIHDFIYTGSLGVACWGIKYAAEGNSITEISNNLIYNIKSDGDLVSVGNINWIPSGISIFSGGNIQIYYNAINMTGNVLGIGPNNNFAGSSACIMIDTAVTNLDVKNNIFKNSMTTASGTGANKTYGIVSYSTNTAFVDINYNDYYIDGLNPNIGYLFGDILTLADWQTATSKDANSIATDPGFISDIDLHPSSSGPNNTGISIPAIITDYAGATRFDPPDMGAYEYLILATVITDSATNVTTNSAQLNGTVTANYASTDVYFEWGLTTSYGNIIPAIPANVDGGLATAVLVEISGLEPNTTYYYRCVGANGAGITYGNVQSFNTLCTLPGDAGLISGISSVCQGTLGVTYSVEVINDTEYYNWIVPSGASIVAGDSTNTITVDFSISAESGIISVQGVNLCGDEGTSSSLNVEVNPIPPTPVISQTNSMLTSDAISGNQWYLDGVIIPGDTAQTIEIVDNGDYSVIVTLNGCSSEISNIITIINAGLTDNVAVHNVSAFPNPSHGHFTVSVTSAKPDVYDMRILNVLGSSVYERKALVVNGTYKMIVDVPNLPQGVYSVVFKAVNHQIVRKIVIN